MEKKGYFKSKISEPKSRKSNNKRQSSGEFKKGKSQDTSAKGSKSESTIYQRVVNHRGSSSSE